MWAMIRRLGRYSLLVLLIGGPVLTWQYKTELYDWARLRDYQPSAAVAKLATDTTMNDAGKHLFYVYKPSVESKDAFGQHCRDTERTIVLGCYVRGTGIYIYDVTDVRLTGVKEVTAAHEMLHVAYDRLKPTEKQRIGALLNKAYGDVSDARIRANIDSYRKAGADVTNELHSILGTEVKTLSPDLEAYYKRYFTDRSRIVAFSNQYEDLFTERQAKVAAAELTLKNLKSQIDSLESSLKREAQELTVERERMNALLSSNQIAAYNAAVPGYNQRVAGYNADVATEKSLIDQYNTIVKERNALVLETNDLIKAIDSRPSTIDTR
jgi:hypothetical protein